MLLVLFGREMKRSKLVCIYYWLCMARCGVGSRAGGVAVYCEKNWSFF